MFTVIIIYAAAEFLLTDYHKTYRLPKFESHTHTFESPIAIGFSTFFKDCKLIKIIDILHTIIYCPLLGEACGSRYGQETSDRYCGDSVFKIEGNNEILTKAILFHNR